MAKVECKCPGCKKKYKKNLKFKWEGVNRPYFYCLTCENTLDRQGQLSDNVLQRSYSRMNSGNKKMVSRGQGFASKVVEINGVSATIKEHAAKIKVSAEAVRHRLNRGWSLHDALTQPTMSLKAKDILEDLF